MSHLPATVETLPPVSRLRHRAEIPMIIISIILVIGMAVALVAIATWGIGSTEALAGVLGAAFLAPLVTVFAIRYMYWKTISNGIEVTPKQFPEIWQMFSELCQAMEFTSEASKAANRTPRLYIVNGNGAINAFASKCTIYNGYVVLHSDLVDIAYLHNNFQGVRFALAHELAHIKCGHVSIWRGILRPPLALIRLDKSLTRAQEYTADRTAALVCPGGAAEMIRILYCGKHMGTRVDIEEHYNSVANHKDGFWLRVVNFFSDHAVGFRRTEALRHAHKGQWDIHGRML